MRTATTIAFLSAALSSSAMPVDHTHAIPNTLVVTSDADAGSVKWWTVVIPDGVGRIRGTAQIDEGYFNDAWRPLVGVAVSEDDSKQMSVHFTLLRSGEVDVFLKCTASDPVRNQRFPARYGKGAFIEYDISWKEQVFLVTLGKEARSEIACPISTNHLELSVSSGRGRVEVYDDPEADG